MRRWRQWRAGVIGSRVQTRMGMLIRMRNRPWLWTSMRKSVGMWVWMRMWMLLVVLPLLRRLRMSSPADLIWMHQSLLSRATRK
jgi:hypothetical protein